MRTYTMVVSSEKLRCAFHRNNGCVGVADMYFNDVSCLFNLAYRSYFTIFAKIFALFAITCILRSECEANANISSQHHNLRSECELIFASTNYAKRSECESFATNIREIEAKADPCLHDQTSRGKK